VEYFRKGDFFRAFFFLFSAPPSPEPESFSWEVPFILVSSAMIATKMMTLLLVKDTPRCPRVALFPEWKFVPPESKPHFDRWALAFRARDASSQLKKHRLFFLISSIFSPVLVSLDINIHDTYLLTCWLRLARRHVSRKRT